MTVAIYTSMVAANDREREARVRSVAGGQAAGIQERAPSGMDRRGENDSPLFAWVLSVIKDATESTS